jgi:hypothetical protein
MDDNNCLFNLFNSDNMKVMSSCFLIGMKEPVAPITHNRSRWLSHNVVDISDNKFFVAEPPIGNFNKMFDSISEYCKNNGRGKERVEVNINIWHSDILSVLKNCENRNLTILIPNLFMKRAMNRKLWSLMNPRECSKLFDSNKDNFKEIYEQYESEDKVVKTIDAKELFNIVVELNTTTSNVHIIYEHNL